MEWGFVRVQPHTLNSNHLQCLAMYSDGLHTGLYHGISDSTKLCDAVLPPVSTSHMCHLFVYLFVCLSVFLGIMCCLPCLFISPFGLFPLLMGSGVDSKGLVSRGLLHTLPRGLGMQKGRGQSGESRRNSRKNHVK